MTTVPPQVTGCDRAGRVRRRRRGTVATAPCDRRRRRSTGAQVRTSGVEDRAAPRPTATPARTARQVPAHPCGVAGGQQRLRLHERDPTPGPHPGDRTVQEDRAEVGVGAQAPSDCSVQPASPRPVRCRASLEPVEERRVAHHHVVRRAGGLAVQRVADADRELGEVRTRAVVDGGQPEAEPGQLEPRRGRGRRRGRAASDDPPRDRVAARSRRAAATRKSPEPQLGSRPATCSGGCSSRAGSSAWSSRCSTSRAGVKYAPVRRRSARSSSCWCSCAQAADVVGRGSGSSTRSSASASCAAPSRSLRRAARPRGLADERARPAAAGRPRAARRRRAPRRRAASITAVTCTVAGTAMAPPSGLTGHARTADGGSMPPASRGRAILHR